MKWTLTALFLHSHFLTSSIAFNSIPCINDHHTFRFNSRIYIAGFGSKSLVAFDGGDKGGDGISDGWWGGGDNEDTDFEMPTNKALNDTMSSKGEVYKVPLKYEKSPIVSFFMRLTHFVWVKFRLYGSMSAYIFCVSKKHVLPVYLIASFSQIVGPKLFHDCMRVSVRSFVALSLLSLVFKGLNCRVQPLLPPISRHEDINSLKASVLPYAVVAGAESNLNWAFANELALRGWNLILVGENKSNMHKFGKNLRANIKSKGRSFRFHAIEANFTKPTAALDVLLEMKNLNIEPEILISSVNFTDNHNQTSVTDLSDEDFERDINRNCVSVTKLVRNFALGMKSRNFGRIMIISDISSATPSTDRCIKSACNAYLKTFASAISMDLENYGVGVTCLLPGKICENKKGWLDPSLTVDDVVKEG
eukprot:CAMPEP_0171455714 /NCGR_PEP_ID=MMETSP0945-20130129/2500_1 /TAXON_ID=109269 /ORGANISM="Vaucheria litorea, Strain CCMP2940" /LENGTH=419 /DNA_ID=CAMNT_0011981013 /DNA_START=47 /DNA_END=1302 /DNA_ORIENTATION=-